MKKIMKIINSWDHSLLWHVENIPVLSIVLTVMLYLYNLR